MENIIYTGLIADFYQGELRLLLMNHKIERMSSRVLGRSDDFSRPVVIIHPKSKMAWIEYVSEDISEYNKEGNVFTCDIEEVAQILKDWKEDSDTPKTEKQIDSTKMRQIKFRGKRLDNGEWVYGSLLQLSDESYIYPNMYADLEDIDFGYGFQKVNPETVGQFTGLKDKNGKEICEGDIVETPYLDPIFGDPIKNSFVNAVIEYYDGSFVVSYDNGSRRIYLYDLVEYITKIGNIHDNPELLK